MAERFSVVTISFNQCNFVERTIRSVLSQAGDFLLEYLIVDGGSTDGSVEIIKKYEKFIVAGKWPINCSGIEYRWVSEPDPGPTAALNKGLKMCRGEFISLLNSDDMYPAGTLMAVVSVFRNHPEVDVVYGKTIFVDENDRVIGNRDGVPLLRRHHFLRDNALVQPEVFWRRRVMEKAGLFDEALAYSNDYEYWLRLIDCGARFFYLPRALVYFRVRPDARSSGLHPGRFIDSLTVQYRYFGIGRYLKVNLGEYAAEFSEKTHLPVTEALKVIREGFLKTLPVEARSAVSLLLQKSLLYGFLKKAAYLSFKDRAQAITFLKAVLKKAPWLLFTRRGFSVLLRLTMGKTFYRRMRRILGGGDVF